VWPQATVLPGLASVLVAFDEPLGRGAGDAADLLAAAVCAGLAAHGGDHAGEPASFSGGTAGPEGRTHSIPVRYDGPDLARVAASLGVPIDEVVARHQSAGWRVAAIGFSPGFGYLTSSDPIFAEVARRPDPRSRVPAGAVALAAGMCAVYPSASPGGWHLIGSTQTRLFDHGAQRPARLRVGDRVMFRIAP
jgi:KipI family sensor histidine kinase inhibitor